VGRCCYGSQDIKDAKEALAKALQGLEEVRMIPRDDPKLSALKNDIRRTIGQTRKSKLRSSQFESARQKPTCAIAHLLVPDRADI